MVNEVCAAIHSMPYDCQVPPWRYANAAQPSDSKSPANAADEEPHSSCMWLEAKAEMRSFADSHGWVGSVVCMPQCSAMRRVKSSTLSTKVEKTLPCYSLGGAKSRTIVNEKFRS